MKNEQKFYSALEDIFIGEAGQKIEGKSGYVNLIKLKSQYFAQIKPFIEKEVNETFEHDSASREEAFQKLYTFFDSYLNETGTPFFSQTPFHKNLYERVYSERDDVALFWKTQRLYYVKSEANYHSLLNLEVDGLTFNFDASQIEHQKNNEKKSLEFWATELTNSRICFKVVYEDNSKAKWDRLKNYLNLSKPDEIRKYLVENFGSKNNPNIEYKDNGLNREGLKSKELQNSILITNNEDLIKSVTVEFVISNLDVLDIWAKQNNLANLTSRQGTIKKAQSLYKKQNEVDYFIHKDAEGFLKEQFDMFLYQYLFGDRHLENEWTESRIVNIQKLKRIAHKIIFYIARFEDELKYIWEKKKIVKKVHYVFTLDCLFPKYENGERDFSDVNAIALVESILDDNNFQEQITEYKNLNSNLFNEKGEEVKSIWQEFSLAANLKKEELILDSTVGKSLNVLYRFLPIDTSNIPNLKYKILEHFKNIDKEIDGIAIKSENFQGLNTILSKYQNSVDIVNIDPPFNLGANADFDYKVNYLNSTWNTLLENRINISKKLLSEKSSYFVRCDYNGNMFVRLIMNSLLGEENFRNEIILSKSNRVKTKGKKLLSWHDTLFYYVTNKGKHFFEHITKSRGTEEWRAIDNDGESWAIIPSEIVDKLSKKNIVIDNKGNATSRARIIMGKEFLPPSGRRFPSQESIWKLESEGKIRLNSNGNPQMLKPDDIPSTDDWTDFIGDTWTDFIGYSSNWNFTTENSEKIISRIIDMSSNKNTDIILDYFLGSGTTAAGSHKRNRKWIGIDIGNHFDVIAIPRLKCVLIGDTSGISEEFDWKGGGIFKYYELEQYEECLQRAVYNPKWLTNNGSINELEQVAYYTFKHSEKLLNALVVDEEKEEVMVHFQNLYPEIDEAAIAESISNVSGKFIKTLNKDKVVFEDDTFIEFAKMSYEDPVFRNHYRCLLWWKSKV